MHAYSAITIIAVAASTLFQACPAPPAIGAAVIGAAGAITGAVAGAEINKNGKRDAVPAGWPSSVSQDEYNNCVGAMKGASVQVSSPNTSEISAVGVPQECMSLANDLAGTSLGGSHPVPLAGNTLRYTGLSATEYNNLKTVFTQHA